MTLQEILSIFQTKGGFWISFFFCCSLLVEVTPVKVNPLSWFAKKIGKAFNGEVMREIGNINKELSTVKQEVKGIKTDVADIREEAKEREATARRTRILEFGDEILHGVDYSKEHWDNVLRDITEYENYCYEHKNYMNHVAKATIKHIKNLYDKHLEDDSFLK